jgi:hypothetical protein
MQEVTVRGSRWFDEWNPMGAYKANEPMPRNSLIREVWQDSTGLLWIRADAPDLKYRGGFDPPGPSRPSGSFAEQRAEFERTRHLRGTWSTIIDVIDPVNGLLLASQRYETQWIGVTPDGLGFSLRTTPQDFQVLDVWQFRIRQH